MVTRKRYEQHAQEAAEAGVRPLSRRMLAACEKVDAELHAKWGWSKDPKHLKECRACKSAVKR